MIKDEEIIGIFDIDICTVEKRLRDYLRDVQQEGNITEVAEDLPQSFIVTKDRVYISGISTGILRQRTRQIIT